MANSAIIKAIITADDQASRVIAKFGDATGQASEKITSKISASAVAVAAATAGIVAFGKKSLDSFEAQELATTRLQTGINNVKSATDKHIDSLLKEATALQKTTRFSDEQYISAQGILSTFQLNQRAIERLTPRLADMSEGLARVTGEMPDLEGNAILVAKAIGGEDTAGLTGTLRKAGVVLTETQQALLKTGSVEDRISVITQVLDDNFKNMAEAAGNTTAGKIAKLKNQFDELKEKVGGAIAVAINPFLTFMIKYPAALAIVTGGVGILVTAFVGMKVVTVVTTAVKGLQIAMLALNVSLGPIGWAIAGIAALVGGLTYLFTRHKKTTDDVSNSSIAQTTATERLSAQMRELALRTDAAKQSQDALKGAQYDAEGASLSLESAQKSYNDALKQYGPTSLEAREAAHRLEGAKRDLEDANNKVAVAQDNENLSEGRFVTNTGLATDAIQLRIDKFSGVIATLSIANDNLTVLDNNIRVKAPALQGSIQNIQGSVQTLQGSLNNLQGSKFSLQGGGIQLQGSRAEGGPVSAGKPYRVGEAGEEVFVPGTSGTIVPNDKLGGSINISINAGAFMGNDVEARKFAQLILSHLKDAAGGKSMTLGQMVGM